jgi:hypothetical protein
MQKNEQWVSDYLSAKSPEALKLKMLSNNIKRATYHEYRIVHDGALWFAWYERPADEILMQEFNRLEGLTKR